MILTDEQGSKARPIVHALFDYSTLRRLLHWLYHGSYEVDAASLQAEVVEGSDKGLTNGNHATWFPPHRSDNSKSSPINTPGKTTKQTRITNAMTAHALVYIAAEHYQLEGLKTISLQKFKDAKEDLSIEAFINLTKVVHANILSGDDPLRGELTEIMLADNCKLMTIESFTSGFKEDFGMHELAVDVITALAQIMTKKSSKEKIATEAQASASKHLLSSLDQANEALVKSSECNKALKSQLAAARAENKDLGAKAAAAVCELQNGARTISSLQGDLEKAIAERNRTESLAKLVEAANKKLEKDVKDLNDLIKKHVSKTETAQANLTFANQQLKAETSRADKNFELYKKRNDDFQIAQTQSDGDLALQISAETARADRGKWIVRAISRLVNSTAPSHSCGKKVNCRLELDDRMPILPKDQQPKMLMLICSCGAKFYGANIK